MTDKVYDIYLPEVLPFIDNCSEMEAINAVRNAVIEFCRSSLYLNQNIDPFTMTLGSNTYPIDVPSGYKMEHVIALYFQGAPILPKSQSELQAMYTRDWQSIPGKPKYFTQFDENSVTVCLNPDETIAQAINGRVAYSPLRSSTKADDSIYERYAELIGWGARARLHSNAEKPYTDAAAATTLLRLFRAECASIRKKVLAGFTPAPMRVRFNRIM